MAYQISEIGQFEIYEPDPRPENAPPGALFSRRVSDGADWYAMARPRDAFPEGAVLATALPGPDQDVFLVQAIFRVEERSKLFPGASLLLQIEGVDPDDVKPHRLFEYQVYRRSTGEIGPIPKPPVLQVTATQAKIQLSRTKSPDGTDLLTLTEALVEKSTDRELKLWFTGAGVWLITSRISAPGLGSRPSKSRTFSIRRI
jgi:hypothetical protein